MNAERYISEELDGAQKCLDEVFGGQKRDDKDVAIRHIWLIHHFITAALMESLRRVDPARADAMAQWVYDAVDDGSSVGELIWQWRDQLSRGHQMTMVGPTPPMPAPPAHAHPVTVQVAETQRFEALGVLTATPGLVAVQKLYRPAKDGEEPRVAQGSWVVVHVGSCLQLPTATRNGSYPLDVAQAVAKRLGELDLDWTQSREAIFESTDHRKRAVEVINDFEGCEYCTDADHLPVRPFRPAASQDEEADRG
jgi:hypothetical protein